MPRTNKAPFSFGVGKWYIARHPGDEGQIGFSEKLVVPEGMNWIVMPPGKNCLDKEVQWFPTGAAAIRYVQERRYRPSNNAIGATA